MRKSKVIVVLDVEVEDNFSDQDMADCFSEVLKSVDEISLKNLCLFEVCQGDNVEEILQEVRDEFI